MAVFVNMREFKVFFQGVGSGVPASGEDIDVELLEETIAVEVDADETVVLDPDTINLGLDEVLNVELVEEEIDVEVEEAIDVVLFEDVICICLDEGT